jgi:hypothetical protein
MTTDSSAAAGADRAENRWPAIVAILAVAGVYAALPESLAVGPRWLQAVVVCALLIPNVIAHHLGAHGVNQVFGHIISAVLTLFMVWSLALLIVALPAHTELPVVMLRSAVALWITNVLVFALWYWRLDGGGPNERDRRGIHTDGAFLFPQMMMDPALRKQMAEDKWSPGFIDYLFLAFNTSTAFSPTDVPVLSRWAKSMMMVQSSISLATLAILAARAINIL